MNYYLIIPFVIILILFLPIRMQVKASFNFLDFSGAFGIFLYKIKVEHQQIWIQNKKIISKKYGEVESKEISLDSDEMIFVETFISQLKAKTHLKEFSIYYNLGANDAFLTSMLAGYINTGLVVLLSLIKNSKPTASLGIYDTVSYNKEVCQFAINGILSISLFDVVYSLLRSVILRKKVHAQKKRESEAQKQEV